MRTDSKLNAELWCNYLHESVQKKKKRTIFGHRSEQNVPSVQEQRSTEREPERRPSSSFWPQAGDYIFNYLRRKDENLNNCLCLWWWGRKSNSIYSQLVVDRCYIFVLELIKTITEKWESKKILKKKMSGENNSGKSMWTEESETLWV